MANITNIQEYGNQLAVIYDDGARQLAYPTNTGLWIVSTGAEPEPPPPPPPSGSRFAWPFNPSTQVTSEFGMRRGRLHAGIDFGKGGVTGGSEIKASAAGTVWKRANTGQHGGYGNTIILDHGSGLFTLYAHMLDGSMAVNQGQTVAQGQRLGAVGNTGASQGNHLHFETHEGGYRWNQSARDPRIFIPKHNA